MTKTRNNDNQPLVSVIMNCYNGQKYLREAIDSVYAQTYKNWEIIFWDNASTDRSAEISKSYDSKLRYFIGNKTIPLGAVRNKALVQCNGEFIAFLDCDDIWLPEKMEKQISLFNNKKVGLVFCDTNYFNEKGVFRGRFEKEKPHRGNVFRKLLIENFLPLVSVVIRRKTLDSLQEWFDVRFNMIEEADLFLRIAFYWEVDYIDEPLAKWRVHRNSWTFTKTELFPIEKQMQIDKYIELYPDFEKKYSREIYLMRASMEYRLAVDYLYLGKRRQAREKVSSYVGARSTYRLLYLLSFLPFPIYRLLRKIYIMIKPDSNI
jgi:glycosyltransferase involved in cell wall biosynthesis